MALPTPFGYLICTEENAGDFAVSRAVLPPIQGTQGKNESVPASLLQRCGIGSGVAVGQAAPESDCGGCANLEELVERQEDGVRFNASRVDVDTKHGATMGNEVFRAVSRDA